MNKKTLIIFLSSALTLTSASAAEVYGSIQLGMTRSYTHNPSEGNMTFTQIGETHNGQPIYYAQRAGSQALAIEDYGSYLGIRGNEDLGNNTQLILDLKWEFNAADGSEFGEGFENDVAMLGIQTEYGTFAIGRQENPFYDTVIDDSVAGDFNALGLSASSAASAEVLLGYAGSINTFDAAIGEYLGNMATYTSPMIAGFTFSAGIVANNKDEMYNTNKYIDIYTLNLRYENESGFYSKLGYYSANLAENANNIYSYAMQLGFRTDDWGLTGNYSYAKNKSGEGFSSGNAHSEFFWDQVTEQTENGYNNQYKHTAKGWDIGTYWAFGADHNTTLRATYGQAISNKKQSSTSDVLANANNNEKNRLRTWSIGAEQLLSERTGVWVEFEHSLVQQKFATSGTQFDYVDKSLNNKKFKDNKVSIGIRHDF